MSAVVMAGESSRPTKLSKSITAFIVVTPIMAVLAIPFVWTSLNIVSAMVQTPIWYAISVASITVSFHRELTHRSLLLKPVARYMMAVFASLGVEGGPFSWCARHKKHHRYTDKPGDPHSPLEGFLHAHFGWFFREGDPTYNEYISYLLKDKGLILIDKMFPILAVASFVVPGLISLVITGTLRAFIAGVFWGGFVRIFFVHHVTWSVNSVCHMWGKKPLRSDDESRDNAFVFLAFGEQYHRCHHAFQRSAKIGLLPGQIDIGWYIIRFLTWIGQVEWVKVPTPEQIASKRLDKTAA